MAVPCFSRDCGAYSKRH